MDASTQSKIEQLRTWIDECPPGGLVFFGGAGVSTESGIPDFRSTTGIYNSPNKYPYPPEYMCSHTFFVQNTPEFFDFYTDRMMALDAKPNRAHVKLAQLEEEGILSAVVTQNIDGLHQAAGSKKVYELHGSVLRNYCQRCNKFYDAYEMLAAREADSKGVPHCTCGGVIKPDVVLYEESLDQNVLEGSVNAIARAHMVLVAGTSLAVYPAAGLLDYFNGKHVAIVNMSPTSKDKMADLCVAASIGDALDY